MNESERCVVYEAERVSTKINACSVTLNAKGERYYIEAEV